MATSHQAAVCCFFVFACAKVIIHSIANARTGTPCLSINLHAIRVVFTRSNSCIHSVITLFFAHQKSKTDCDADGSVQKKTQIQWKQTKISTPAQLQDANIFQTHHAKRGKILNPLKSWFH